jgi:hypothetical protein
MGWAGREKARRSYQTVLSSWCHSTMNRSSPCSAWSGSVP